MSAEQIHLFLQLRNQIKLYHWQTREYSRHIATDKAVEQLDTLIDKYVEVYIGKYGRPKITKKTGCFSLFNMSEAGAVKIIGTAIRYMQGTLTKSLKKEDTDLANIRDEIVADLNQLLYLFTLK
jgi:hypothetical protein